MLSVCLIVNLISISTLSSEMTRAEKEMFVKRSMEATSFSNRMVQAQLQFKDERLKYIASTNINWIEREKTKVWKDRSRSWLDRLGDFILIGIAVAIFSVISK